MAQQFSGLPMRSLIGGPLNAAAQANSMMAITQTKFLLNTCFNSTQPEGKDKDGKTTLTPIMVTMQLTRGLIDETPGEGGKPGKVTVEPLQTTFELPLLTLIPLNSLAVTDVQVGFDMEVKSSYSDESSQQSSSSSHEQGSFDAKIGEGFWSVEVKGSVSHDSSSSSSNKATYQKSNNAKYTVSVTAGQLPLPEGVTTIIQAYTSNISPVTVGGTQS
ncbi:MAG TPA: hypothetical protein DEA26_05105 [Oceanospirillales bacterium]|nr:hypothetical protein [Oceanospirillaceae bacterium]HBS42037.1 hypothetical protein [Oceanospirillales bacterium]